MKPHVAGHDEELTETDRRIMSFLESAALSRSRIAEMLGIKSGRGGQLSRTLERLRNLGLIKLTIPEKPRSRNQKMRLSEKGKARLARR